MKVLSHWNLTRLRLASSLLTTWLLVAGICPAEEQWSRFRGPNGAGISDLKGIPTTWAVEDYEWVVDLPGVGHSSPVLWNDKLFLTSGDTEGNRLTLCLNGETGKEIWRHSFNLGANHLHKKNSYGSGTPAADADRVYVIHGSEEQFLVMAFSHAGELLWEKDLGTYAKEHGEGNSPLIYKDLVIVPYDQTGGPSAVVALDAKSGDMRWSSPRGEHKASYATPMVLDVQGYGDQIINITGGSGYFGLDPQTGNELWASGRLPERSVGSPIYAEANNLLIGSCGSGGIGRLMIAVEPGGKGDVSASHIKGERTKGLPYVPTPLVKDHYLYLWNDNGIAYCVDLNAHLTQSVWEKRIGENYSSSPVMIDGKIYCISEDGNVFVIDASPEYKLYGKSPLGDKSYSTPAVGNGRLYLRGFSKLASLKARD